MTILVTGASGHLGRLAVEALLERGAEPASLRAGARDVTRIADLAAKGVEAVRLDYTDAASVAEAVAGADQVLLISSSEVGQRVAQHTAVIDAATAAGVTQLVYTSAPRADTSDLLLAPEHKATEEAIAAAGIPATILRNNWYTENYASAVEQARATGELVSSVGDGVIASASRRDYAEAAAVVLLEDGHVGRTYELGGDTAWTQRELAEVVSGMVGRDVVVRTLNSEEHVAELVAAGLDEGTAGFIAALDAGIRGGALAEVTGELSTLIGRPTTPLEEGLRTAL